MEQRPEEKLFIFELTENEKNETCALIECTPLTIAERFKKLKETEWVSTKESIRREMIARAEAAMYGGRTFFMFDLKPFIRGSLLLTEKDLIQIFITVCNEEGVNRVSIDYYVKDLKPGGGELYMC